MIKSPYQLINTPALLIDNDIMKSSLHFIVSLGTILREIPILCRGKSQ